MPINLCNLLCFQIFHLIEKIYSFTKCLFEKKKQLIRHNLPFPFLTNWKKLDKKMLKIEK